MAAIRSLAGTRFTRYSTSAAIDASNATHEPTWHANLNMLLSMRGNPCLQNSCPTLRYPLQPRKTLSWLTRATAIHFSIVACPSAAPVSFLVYCLSAIESFLTNCYRAVSLSEASAVAPLPANLLMIFFCTASPALGNLIDFIVICTNLSVHIHGYFLNRGFLCYQTLRPSHRLSSLSLTAAAQARI
jgi:hypothetical protein